MNYKYIVNNDKILTRDQDRIFFKGEVVYEVIRVVNGKVLFLTDHLDRLEKSVHFIEEVTVERAAITQLITQLIAKEKVLNNNIKIKVGNITSRGYDLKMLFVESFYPSEKLYQEGVKTITVEKLRHHPTMKFEDKAFKNEMKTIMSTHHVYECILKDTQNKIFEGSRSNVIFVKGETFITSKKQDILQGITMKNIKKVIEKSANFSFVHREVFYEELEQFDGAFLTGTSINILPIHQIDDIIYRSSNNINIQILMEKFNELRGGSK